MKYQTVIGIDPDVDKSGVAELSPQSWAGKIHYWPTEPKMLGSHLFVNQTTKS